MDRFVLKSSRSKPDYIEVKSSEESRTGITDCSNNIVKLGQKRNIETDFTLNDDYSDTESSNDVIGEKQRKKPKQEEEKPCSSSKICIDSGNYKANFIKSTNLKWQKLTGENLNCTHCILLTRPEADNLLKWFEDNVKYIGAELSKVRIMGKWHEIARKQTAMGEPGLSYTFSGKTVTASTWIPEVKHIRDQLHEITGFDFNFVLINRYKDGDDHIGEHQDDEKELVAKAPIASLTLGQARDFVFKHKDSRGKNAKRKMNTVKIELRHGMLLLMNYPTNTYWYHSLPKRKGCPGVRINMTFRVFHPQQFRKGT